MTTKSSTDSPAKISGKTTVTCEQECFQEEGFVNVEYKPPLYFKRICGGEWWNQPVYISQQGYDGTARYLFFCEKLGNTETKRWFTSESIDCPEDIYDFDAHPDVHAVCGPGWVDLKTCPPRYFINAVPNDKC